MASYEPAFLPIGTDVSAKYRGAFCEAKVKKVIKQVKCKIFLKETQTSVFVTDENITGPLKVGSTVEVKHPDTGQQAEGVINKVTDCSTYTVVFDDADERTLRRTQLCLKGEKHFEESETLDNLPLSNPEHFGTPVLQNKKSRRSKAGDSDSEEEETSSEDESPKRATYKGRFQELVGKVMCLESSDKRKGALTPVLVVLPDAQPMDLKSREQLLVRSFRDAKFMVVNRKDLKDFSREIAIKSEDKNMKAAFEKALLYYDSHELPPNWKREELLGPDDDSDVEEDDTSDDDEPCEEKDRFVAQLYKFMDDRGTPINKGPCVGNKDLNLYRLFRVVQNLGGYNRVTNQMKWRLVYSKMGLPPSNTASHQIKNAYKKYLHAFEDFYRKLGSTMGTISRPGRSRQSSGRGLLPFRGREKDSSPRSPRTEKAVAKEDKTKEEEKSKGKAAESAQSQETEEVGESTPVEESDSDPVRRSTPRREKAQKEEVKAEKKEESKAKKEKEKEEERKEENKKEEVKEEKTKKEERREERKSLRQSLKEDEKKEGGKGKEKEKEEEKKDSKKDDAKPERVLRRERDEKEEEPKKEPEDNKEMQKKRVTRRKSSRFEEDKKDMDEKEEEEKSEEEKSRREKKEKKMTATKKEKVARKRTEEEDSSESKDKESEEVESEDEPSTESGVQEEYPTGTRLRVKYGRGRNQKIYEAKVVESGKEGPHKNYLVHYSGWNTRYDEWVRPDRIVAVVDKPETAKLKKKAAGTKSPKQGAASPKPEVPVPRKRGRQPSVQQVPSPAGASTKSLSPASDSRTPKGKTPSTPSGSASKTRSMRSNSTEIKAPEALPAPTKHRMTRRTSNLNESVEEQSSADQDMASESDLESETAPPSASGGDLTWEREEEEEQRATSSGELDISVEEGVEPLGPVEEDTDKKPGSLFLPSTSMASQAERDEGRNKEPEVVPEFVPVESKSLPERSPREAETTEVVLVSAALAEPETVGVPSIVQAEPPSEAVKMEPVQAVQPLAVTPVPEVKPELVPVLPKEPVSEVQKAAICAGPREETVSKESSAAEPKPEVVVPQTDLAGEEKPAVPEDPSIPELKKIDMDIVPEDRKEIKEKEKVKAGKKAAKEVRKGRQNEMRTSLSEIPTLEPMTTPDSKAKVLDTTPSPYDFTESEPDAWQPEITKKWEPNNKMLPLFRDSKQELKKSLESEKKKVKKKMKKVGGVEESGSTDKTPGPDMPQKAEESKTRESCAEPQQDKSPVKKKGRKKKDTNADIQRDTSTYEETVNSVVESCRLSADLPEPFPAPEEKKEKPVKKRKNKTLEAAAIDEKESADVAKKDGLKKGVKGNKAGKKKLKEGKPCEEPVSNNTESAVLPQLAAITSQEPDTSGASRQKRVRSQSPESASSKRLHVDTSVLSVASALPLSSGTSVLRPSPSGASVSSAVSVKQDTAVSGLVSVDAGNAAPGAQEGQATVRQNLGAVPPAEIAAVNAQGAGAVGSTVLDNTPPTTPENDPEEANSGSSSDGQDNLKDEFESLDSLERTYNKVRSESPSGGEYSLSSASSDNLPAAKTGAPSSKVAEPEASTSKRKRNTSEDAAAKKKRRLNSRSCRPERNRGKSPKYVGDEERQSESRSAIDLVLAADLHTSGLMAAGRTELPKPENHRPPKFHFTDDLGHHLSGEQRIDFLMSKMMEIRKEYARIKSEIAAIDRKRKRARRREKEKESSQASQGERDDS